MDAAQQPHRPQMSDDDSQWRLERDRARNDQKLKSRFEHIFRKYAHDFTGVGDEIDIESGEVVVDNGHLQHMRDEVDPGRSASASSRFVRTFQDALGHEDESTSSNDAEDLSASYETDDDSVEVRSDEGGRPGRSGSNAHMLEPFAALSRPVPRLAQLLVGEGTPQPLVEDEDNEYSSVAPSRGDTPATVLGQVPGLGRSIAAAESARASVDPDTLQALGTTIANQLAQLMASSSNFKAKKAKQKTRMSSGDPAWSYPELNVRNRQKRRRSPSPVQMPASSSPVARTPGNRSLWSAMPPASKRRREDLYSDPSEAPLRRFGKGTDTPPPKRCWNCSLIRASSWHRGPHGQDLCASCYQYYDVYGRMKSLDSPTPSVEAQDQSPRSTSAEPGPEFEEQITYEEDTIATPVGGGTTKRQGDVYKERHRSQLVQQDPRGGYAANTSRPMSATPARQLNSKFTTEEDAVIIKLKEQDRLTWESIGRHLPHRTIFSVQHRYSSVLRDQPGAGRTLYHEQYQATDDGHDPARDSIWDQEQDHLLLNLRQNQELGWPEIASLLPGHDADAAHKRYSTLVGRRREQRDQTPMDRYLSMPLEDHGHDTVSRRHERFRPEEDALLVRLKEIDGLSWFTISQAFTGRPLSAIQKRYSSTLTPAKRSILSTRPQDSIEGTMRDRILAVDPSLAGPSTAEFRSEPFEPQEDDLIKVLREIEQLDWDEISMRLDRRPAKLVQNRYQYGFPRVQNALSRLGEPMIHSTEASVSVASQRPAQATAPTIDVTNQSRSTSPDDRNRSLPCGSEASLPASGTKYTPSEMERLGHLRAQGVSWSNMIEHFPGRTVRGLQSCWSKHAAKPLKGRTSLPAHLGAAGTPLLRQALDNSLRRRSEGGPSQTLGMSRLSVGDDLDDSSNIDGYDIDPSMQLSDELQRSYQDPSSRLQVTDALAQSRIEPAGSGNTRSYVSTLPTSSQPILFADELGSVTVPTGDPSKDPDFVPPNHGPTPSGAADLRRSRRRRRTEALSALDPESEEVSVGDRIAESHAELEQSNDEATKRETEAMDTAHTGSLDEPARPEHSWSELIFKAFAATQSQTMTCKDLCTWIEGEYEYYRRTKSPWKDSIRAELSGNTMFEKASSATSSTKLGEWRSRQALPEEDESSRLPEKRDGDIMTKENSGINLPGMLANSQSRKGSTAEAVPSNPPTVSHVDEGEIQTATQPPNSDNHSSRHVTFDPQVRVTTPIVSVYNRPKFTPRIDSKHVRRVDMSKGDALLEVAESDAEEEIPPVVKPVTPKGLKGDTAPSSGGTYSDLVLNPQSSSTRLSFTERQPAPQLSSSPRLTRSQTPTITHKTPANSRIGQVKSHSTPRRHSTPIISYRWSSPAPGLSRRVVETPVRDLKDPGEDELAG